MIYLVPVSDTYGSDRLQKITSSFSQKMVLVGNKPTAGIFSLGP
jgi:hypothetical protein